MRLTLYTDYSIRVLVFLTARTERLSSISEISQTYGISKNHLMKVVHDLGRAGLVTTVRGRSGGIKLARPASEITVGEVVRLTEDGFDLVDCSSGSCIIARACGIRGILKEATRAFLAVLDGYTFGDLPKSELDILDVLAAFPDARAKPGADVAALEPAAG
ncbi:Rrf2 family transcriptional regulator [Antarcticirhabdus aurantiaca]|uniref:Rrf2 family transcriptional regulator n=1 Tax=Antarcticirhabdus aurantiaca TaxID=2606717 RepID=A0ACD4NRX3_9HYPH|nr:Rrf2 family transcriptional regulator [Antarcticirhabdus aurantiaca]WAJ29477.1 Rrf2 family transcriptional regulator [Jeongeuplla avenae]